MAAPIRPAGTSIFGRQKWLWVATIADPTAPDLSAEIGAVTTVDLSGFLYVDGFDGPGADTSRVTAPRRVMDQTLLSALGATTYTMGDLIYAVDPQAAANSDEKLAYETLTEGEEGWLVYAPGVDPDVDLTAGKFVLPFQVALGPQVATQTSTDEAGEFAIKQGVALLSTPPGLVAIVA